MLTTGDIKPMQNNNNDETFQNTLSTWLLSQPTLVVVLMLFIAGMGYMLVQANERNREVQTILQEALIRKDSLLSRCYHDYQEDIKRLMSK
jgi:hypothetical protein